MKKDRIHKEHLSISSRDVLTTILRQGAQEMLAKAVENEVAEYLSDHEHLRDRQGHRLVVRNGYLPRRMIQTGVGQVEVQQPRVNDKRVDENGQRIRFSSKILPPYLRRTKSIEELIPWLYLKGISTGDFTEAQQAFDLFVTTFEAKYLKAIECLQKDREVLLTFYDFPAEHWVHLRTTNPIESTFATVRLRTARTKGCGSRTACLTMVFKLAQCAESHWRRLNGKELIAEVIEGIKFVDGLKEIAA